MFVANMTGKAPLVLDDLVLFSRVVELGAFAKVARERGVPTSTVSRAVARLEAALDVRLVHRTTRVLRTTADGAALHQRALPALRELKEAVTSTAAAEHEPRGRLRITAPTDLGAAFVADVVSEYVAAHPSVSVEVSLTQEVVDLVKEGFDVALRAGRLTDSSLVARRVGGLESQLFASPAYLKRRGAPSSVKDLLRHDLVLFRAIDGGSSWTLDGPRGEVKLDVKGRVGGDDFLFVRAAALAGAGIALMPRVICASELRDGRLVRVLEPWESRASALYFVYPTARHVPAKVTAFRDFLLARFTEPHAGRGAAERRGSRRGASVR